MDEWILRCRDRAGWCRVDRAVDGHTTGVEMDAVHRRCAGNDAVEVSREAHGFGDPLTTALRATVPNRKCRRAAVKGVDDRLGLDRHLVHGAVTEVDHLLWMPKRECGGATDVTRVRAGGRVASQDGVRHGGIWNVARPTAIAHRLKLPVPPRCRKPHFDLD